MLIISSATIYAVELFQYHLINTKKYTILMLVIKYLLFRKRQQQLATIKDERLRSNAISMVNWLIFIVKLNNQY